MIGYLFSSLNNGHQGDMPYMMVCSERESQDSGPLLATVTRYHWRYLFQKPKTVFCTIYVFLAIFPGSLIPWVKLGLCKHKAYLANKSLSSCSEQKGPRLATNRVEQGAFGPLPVVALGWGVEGLLPRGLPSRGLTPPPPSIPDPAGVPRGLPTEAREARGVAGLRAKAEGTWQRQRQRHANRLVDLRACASSSHDIDCSLVITWFVVFLCWIWIMIIFVIWGSTTH